jgi:hypothetical protein
MKKLVFFLVSFLAIVALLSSCQKNVDTPEIFTTAYLVGGELGSVSPEDVTFLGDFLGEGPHTLEITDQEWEVVKNCPEIYISWQKYSKDEKIYIDDGYIDIKDKDELVFIP